MRNAKWRLRWELSSPTATTNQWMSKNRPLFSSIFCSQIKSHSEQNHNAPLITYHFSAAADLPASFCTLKQFSFEIRLLFLINCRILFFCCVVVVVRWKYYLNPCCCCCCCRQILFLVIYLLLPLEASWCCFSFSFFYSSSFWWPNSSVLFITWRKLKQSSSLLSVVFFFFLKIARLHSSVFYLGQRDDVLFWIQIRLWFCFK